MHSHLTHKRPLNDPTRKTQSQIPPLDGLPLKGGLSDLVFLRAYYVFGFTYLCVGSTLEPNGFS